jgi:hypothetical protein
MDEREYEGEDGMRVRIGIASHGTGEGSRVRERLRSRR